MKQKDLEGRVVTVYKWTRENTRGANERVLDYTGTFLRFGIDYEELDGGPGLSTTAIILLSDGRMTCPAVEMVQFDELTKEEELDIVGSEAILHIRVTNCDSCFMCVAHHGVNEYETCHLVDALKDQEKDTSLGFTSKMGLFQVCPLRKGGVSIKLQ